MLYLKLLFFLPLTIFLYQLYNYASSRKGVHKEHACYGLGICYMSAGIVMLIFHDVVLSFLGLLLIMLSLLLLANGLQRKDRKIFIDRYTDDDKIE